MESLVQIDKAATLWINHLSTEWLDPFWRVLSQAEVWYPVYGIIAIFVLWKLGWKKGLAVVLSVILCVLLVDQGSNLVKYSVARLRPCFDPWMNTNGIRLPSDTQGHGQFGFFSAHAGNSFGFAATSFLGMKWNKPDSRFGIYGWCVFVWATLVSVSRIMMGAHFLGDILVGALVGLGIGLLCAWLARLTVVKAKL